MKRQAHRSRKPRPAAPSAKVAWRSLLLTFSFLLSVAGVGHILGVYHPNQGGEEHGLRVTPMPATAEPVHMLPCYQAPAEQSIPDIPFLSPLLVADVVDVPDLDTTPEEAATGLPIIDFPESLHKPGAAPRKQVATRTRRPLAAPAPVSPPESTAATAAVSAHINPPAYKSAPPPPYPAEMRAERARGIVRVRIDVSPTGIPTAVHITSSSGHRLFDTTAKSWILRHWRFTPALRGGTPVASKVSTRVEFVLDNA